MNAFDIIEKEIGRHAKTVVIGHIQPDGDCLGSSMGIAKIIEDNWGVRPVVVNQPIARFSFMGKWTLPGQTDYSDAFVIQVDNSTRDRSADPSFMEAPAILKIDHHLVVDSYGHWNVEEILSSCCEIIARHAFEKGLEITPEAASFLYTGMVTDTGRFAFSGVNADTLMTASKLVATGFDMPALISRLDMRSMDSARYAAHCCENLQISEGGVLWLYVPDEVQRRFNLSVDQVSEALGVMRGIEGHPVWVLFSDLDGKIRVELRSDRINIVEVARAFGGGGHACACGARLSGPGQIPDVVKALEAYMPR